jgi:hypothetical protein
MQNLNNSASNSAIFFAYFGENLGWPTCPGGLLAGEIRYQES